MIGWGAVFAVVTAVDIHALATGKPTLSGSFRACSRRHPLLLPAATAYMIAHLFGALPRTADPLTRLGGTR